MGNNPSETDLEEMLKEVDEDGMLTTNAGSELSFMRN